MNNIKYYYAIFSRTIKKNKMRFLYFTHHFFFLLFFFIEEKTISTLFFIIFYLQQTRLRILCGSLRRTIQIIQYKFSSNDISSNNIFFFFFHTPIQPLIAIVSRVTIIYIPFSPHTRRSTFLLITREHSGALIWATGEIRRPRLLHA